MVEAVRSATPSALHPFRQTAQQVAAATSRTLPGVMRPSASALSIMLRPILSFTLEQGSIDSSFAATRATLPFVTSFK